MIANALLFTIVILLAYGFRLLDQLKFMARYKAVVYHAYGITILIFLAVLFVNLFGAALAISRRFFLKNTGRKLSHLDKQFNVRHAPPAETPQVPCDCAVGPGEVCLRRGSRTDEEGHPPPRPAVSAPRQDH